MCINITVTACEAVSDKGNNRLYASLHSCPHNLPVSKIITQQIEVRFPYSRFRF